jgi:hypothetical protein
MNFSRLLFLLLVTAMQFCSAQDRGFLLPVPPAHLLKCLPPASAPWTLTASKGKHELNLLPMSKAERTYTRPLPANPAAPAGEKQIETVKIRLIDIGDMGSVSETFDERRSHAQKTSIGSLPAYRLPGTGEADKVEMLLLNRFVVTLTLLSPQPGKVDAWVEKINGHMLRSLADKQEFFSPKESYEFVAEKVDELNPKQSKKIVWSIAPTPDYAAATQ